jgi:hypothetical protein
LELEQGLKEFFFYYQKIEICLIYYRQW